VEALVEALLEQLPEDNNNSVISVKQENLPSPPPNGQGPLHGGVEYDPTVVFILEFCTKLATRDDEAVEAAAKPVFDIVQGILRDSSQWHAITVSRSTFYAFQILKASYEHEIVNVPYLLHSVSSLPKPLLDKAAEPLLAGLAPCLDQPGSLRSEMMTSPDFWSILRILARSRESAGPVFEILEKGSTGNPPAIMADNYEAAIGLLSDFASASAPRPRPDHEHGPRRPDQPLREPKK
jgi:golgi-specific brefeldin A-resistance guanine nucleotide exchange factor 1